MGAKRIWAVSGLVFLALAGPAAAAESANAAVTVNVKQNQPPVAVRDITSTKSNTAKQILVLANDTDSDGTIAPATVAFTTPRSAKGGALAKTPDGLVTYTPPTDFLGTDMFYYTVKDDNGATSNKGKVMINVVR